ncbi:MAG: hypothetical protein ACRD2Z_08395 [Thermoanaerobaculia bacterium]
MQLTEEQKRAYITAMEVARREIEECDRAIQRELSRLKERLAELQGAKEAALKMYAAACMRLGRPNELEEADDVEIGRAEGETLRWPDPQESVPPRGSDLISRASQEAVSPRT